MNSDFQKLLAQVVALHEQLIVSTVYKRAEIPKECEYPGVYVLSERGKWLYVGRSRNVRARVLLHSQPGRKWNAPFAFLLAREATLSWQPSYRPVGSRKHLLANKAFLAAFVEQAQRIACMDVRLVRVDDPVTQALLEIYSSTVLATPYNDFKTT
jgi:hypothetical protein